MTVAGMIERILLTDEYEFSEFPLRPPRTKNHSADLVPIPGDGFKCNARMRRTRGYCNKSPMANGRCKYHGGLTRKHLSDPHTDIKRFRHQYLESKQQERFAGLADGDLLQSLEESVHIQQLLEAAALERFATGESPEAWRRMITRLESLSELDPFDCTADSDAETLALYAAAVRREVSEMKEMATKGARDWEVIAQVQELHEGQRKITESLYKSRNLQQKTYTEEQVEALLNTIVITIREQGTPDMIQSIAAKIALMTGVRGKVGGEREGTIRRVFAPTKKEKPIEVTALAVMEGNDQRGIEGSGAEETDR